MVTVSATSCATFSQRSSRRHNQYGTHPHVKLALKGVPREKVVILTKTHASTAEEMRADLDRFRKELGTDYVDIMLLHCMLDADCMDANKICVNSACTVR